VVQHVTTTVNCVDMHTLPLAYSPRVQVVFLEWTDPLFNGGHWTPALIELVGGTHPLNPVPPGEDSAGPSFVVRCRLGGSEK
jgi:hypothetical protein